MKRNKRREVLVAQAMLLGYEIRGYGREGYQKDFYLVWLPDGSKWRTPVVQSTIGNYYTGGMEIRFSSRWKAARRILEEFHPDLLRRPKDKHERTAR